MGNLWASPVFLWFGGYMGFLSGLVGGALSLVGGRNQQKAANAQAQYNMSWERDNMMHQNNVAREMAATQNAFNAEQAAKSRDWQSAEAGVARDWNAGQAQEARDWNATQFGIERSFNAEEAAKNRDYQKMMSDTQYQRATADMKAAGLNPMLGYSQGGAGNVSGSTASASAGSSGAASTSAPSGATASGSAAAPAGLARAHAAQQFNTLATAVSTAAQVSQMVAGVENVQAQTEKTKSEGEVQKWLAAVARAKLGDEFNVSKVARSEIMSSVSKGSEDYSRAWGEEHRSESAKLDRVLKEFAVPKAKGDAEFHQMMMEMFKGGSSSASGLAGFAKMFIPMIFKMLEK